MNVDRRQALAGLAFTGALAGCAPALAGGGASVGGASARALWSTPEDRLRNYVRVRGALDDRLVMGWVTARYYGIVDDRMDPIFEVSAATFARYRAVEAGYEAVSFELAWFTDPATGEPLDNWRNPYTGEMNSVPSGGLPPSKIIIDRNLSFQLPEPRPGLTVEHEVLPIDVRGNDVWLTERSRTAAAFGAGKPFRYSETNTFRTTLSALTAPGAMIAPAEVIFTNVTSWRPWMQMGDRPGHLTAAGYGRQNATWDSFPEPWLRATRARRPEVIADPAAILAPLWNA